MFSQSFKQSLTYGPCHPDLSIPTVELIRTSSSQAFFVEVIDRMLECEDYRKVSTDCVYGQDHSHSFYSQSTYRKFIFQMFSITIGIYGQTIASYMMGRTFAMLPSVNVGRLCVMQILPDCSTLLSQNRLAVK